MILMVYVARVAMVIIWVATVALVAKVLLTEPQSYKRLLLTPSVLSVAVLIMMLLWQLEASSRTEGLLFIGWLVGLVGSLGALFHKVYREKCLAAFAKGVLVAVVAIVLIVLLAAGGRSLFGSIYTVAGDSMSPAYPEGIKVYATTPDGGLVRGNVVLWSAPGGDGRVLVFRVLAVPGDTLQVRNRQLYINDVPTVPLAETVTDIIVNTGPVTIPAGKYYIRADAPPDLVRWPLSLAAAEDIVAVVQTPAVSK